MRGIKNFIYTAICLVLLGICSSCGKDWLEAKPDELLVVPSKISDFQALLDNTDLIFNKSQSTGLGEISAGDFYLLYSGWQSLFNVQEKSAYIWEETGNFYASEISLDWSAAYKRILNANVVLEGINKIKPAAGEQDRWNNVKGSALLFRAFDFYSLSQEYCKVYDPATAAKEMGVPVRLDYDVNVNVKRGTLQQTYDQVINDLKIAAGLLGPAPLFKTRPSKQAAFALLARVFLSMEAYGQAGVYADSALKIQSELLDYSSLKATNAFPFAKLNTEVILHSTFNFGIFYATRLLVDPELYASYSENDYRRSLFFATNANGASFKGNYCGDRSLFGGLATDELYLIRAECSARKGDFNGAMDDLNHLLKTRWKGVYTDLSAKTADEALRIVLKERRKELVFRGLRWSDLRRLNRDERFKVTLTRVLNGKTYQLLPNDKRYIFPLDEVEIRLNGIPQNDR
jgi:hypothetical protein